ncbi:ANTAR domain-containing response regulator [Acuticoccus sp. I52.16.1]|uniref:ANTAR domain-containing response regulator n=1 Tax=Acuticoccus sp. I52.16.1 TaxID=2928472 RepID=UPI001FD21FCD|nr:ANTAR domain-containing protein [Acuticoccus sp. I52.16.1]UOM33239.1 ANTAR domain-containing protein [Acuticoccus sp. I52.16.1]
MRDAGLKILVIDENAIRAAILEEGLREAGFANVTIVRNMANLLRSIVDADPDVIIIDLENPNRDVLEQMFQVSQTVRRPVAMFVGESGAEMIERAVEAGVSTYIVDGLKKERVKPILDMTLSRFNAFNRLQRELEDTRKALEDRKAVDRAKALLMERRGLTERDAYHLLRKAAMNEHRTIGEVARSIITAADLLEGSV